MYCWHEVTVNCNWTKLLSCNITDWMLENFRFGVGLLHTKVELCLFRSCLVESIELGFDVCLLPEQFSIWLLAIQLWYNFKRFFKLKKIHYRIPPSFLYNCYIKNVSLAFLPLRKKKRSLVVGQRLCTNVSGRTIYFDPWNSVVKLCKSHCVYYSIYLWVSCVFFCLLKPNKVN